MGVVCAPACGLHARAARNEALCFCHQAEMVSQPRKDVRRSRVVRRNFSTPTVPLKTAFWDKGLSIQCFIYVSPLPKLTHMFPPHSPHLYARGTHGVSSGAPHHRLLEKTPISPKDGTHIISSANVLPASLFKNSWQEAK